MECTCITFKDKSLNLPAPNSVRKHCSYWLSCGHHKSFVASKTLSLHGTIHSEKSRATRPQKVVWVAQKATPKCSRFLFQSSLITARSLDNQIVFIDSISTWHLTDLPLAFSQTVCKLHQWPVVDRNPVVFSLLFCFLVTLSSVDWATACILASSEGLSSLLGGVFLGSFLLRAQVNWPVRCRNSARFPQQGSSDEKGCFVRDVWC